MIFVNGKNGQIGIVNLFSIYCLTGQQIFSITI